MYVVSGNSFFNCSAIAFVTNFASGASSRGGGVSFIFGSNSYSINGAAAVAGHTALHESSIIIDSNTFSNCSSSFASTFDKLSFQVNAMAGAVSVHIGPSTLSAQNASRELLVRSHLHVVNSIVHITANSFRDCFAELSTRSCLPILSSARGGAVSFDVSSEVFARMASLDLLVHRSTFEECFARWSCSSQDSAVVVVAGGAVAFVSASLPLQTAIVVSQCNFTNVSATGNSFVFARNFSVSGGALFMNASSPLDVLDCTFISSNSSGAIIRSAANAVVFGGGSAIHSLNVPVVKIQRCFFQFSATYVEDRGAIVVSENSINQTLPGFRLVQVINSHFVSSGLSSLLLAPMRSLSSDTLSFINSTISSPKFASFIALISSSAVIKSSNSTIACAAAFHVSVANNSQFLTMKCDRCPVLSYSYSSDELSLEILQRLQETETSLDSLSNCYNVSRSDVAGCPYGVTSCTGAFVVTPGLWLFFKNTSSNRSSLLSYSPTEAARCPAGFCECKNTENGGCEVTAPLDLYLKPDSTSDTALCSGNRTGVLCSHCLAGFTATVDERGCMPNDDCREKLAWIWALVLFSYLMYGLYIALSCLNDRSGIMSALLYFGQMSQFALPRFPGHTSSSFASSLTRIAHFDSIISSVENTCLGTDMSTYRLVLVKLWGPFSVLVFALLWAWLLKRVQRSLASFSLNRTISYFGTSAQCILLIFSSVSAAVFKLVQCTDIKGIGAVFFLDGSRPCYDGVWVVMICAVAVLVSIPLILSYLLFYSKLPLAARYAMCSSYTENAFFWAAVTLSSRMFMSLAAAFSKDPTVAHCVLLLITVLMTLLLIQFQPYKQLPAYRIDLLCHVCLIVQFCCSLVSDASESVGISLQATGALPCIRPLATMHMF